MDALTNLVALLADKSIDVRLINQIFNKLPINSRRKIKTLEWFLVGRKSVALRAEAYDDFDDPLIRMVLYLKHCELTKSSIGEEEFFLFLELIKDRIIRSSLLKFANRLLKQDQIRFIVFNLSGLHTSEYFRLAKRALLLGEVELFDKISEKIHQPQLQIKLELLRRYFSRQALTLEEIEAGFRKLDDHKFTSYFECVPSFKRFENSEKNFFDIRYNTEKQRCLAHLVIQHLEQRQSFSIMRLSDGEAYGFSNCPKLSARQETHWWGGELPAELRAEVKKDFSDSMQNKLNVLGMPTPYKFVQYLRYNNNLPISLDEDLDKRVTNRLAYTMHALMKKLSTHEIDCDYLTEDQINKILFTPAFLNEILSKAERLVVITGFCRELISRSFFHPKLVVKEIPTHNMNVTRSGVNLSSMALPYVYKDIDDWIRSNVTRGDLCLISAGFIGKIFVTSSARCGAVAIDLGQGIDNFIQSGTEIDDQNRVDE